MLDQNYDKKIRYQKQHKAQINISCSATVRVDVCMKHYTISLTFKEIASKWSIRQLAKVTVVVQNYTDSNNQRQTCKTMTHNRR